MIATLSPLIQQPPHRFPRGARPSPRHVLAAAAPHRPNGATPPPQVAYVPKTLSYWLNDQYGDCVSAEEAFAKACYGLDGQGGVRAPEIVIPDDVVGAWARRNGYLNGADLSSVMRSMEQSGFQVGAQRYDDGGYASVDYSNEDVLRSAIAQGPVKIAIDASALPSGAGSRQGWYALAGGNWPNTDHCISICGCGPAEWLYEQLQVALPSAIPPTLEGYLGFSWSTIGFFVHSWIMGACQEAWVRNPTTVGVPPLAPPVPPTPPAPTLTLPGALPAGSYAVGEPHAARALIYVPSAMPAGSYPLQVPTPPAPASPSANTITKASRR